MNGTIHGLIELAQQARTSDAPHRGLSGLLLRVRGDAHRGVHAAAVERLLAATPDLAKAQEWAAEMQLGAEGFDNTTSARAYRDVQVCLRNAGHELARACEILLAQD